MGLAAEPRRRRPQPEDRLEPDAHQQRPAEATSTSSSRARSPRSCRRSAATSSAAAGTTWWSASKAEGEEWSPLRLARPQGLVAAGAGDPRLPDPARHPRRRGVPARRRARRRRSTTPSSSTTTTARVYFNVLANGMPYLLGNERFKGSHSMSGYHSTELCYLAAVYTNLLITKQPIDLLLQAAAGRLQGPHPARLAGHPAAGQRSRSSRCWIDGAAVDGLRRRAS